MANKQIRVLLVEDNPGDVRLIKELLSQEDAQKDGASFHLECAARLSTALERVSSGDIDVLLLDLGLPDSQGFDTYRRLHAQAPEVPIVVLTGLDDAALATRTVREGAQDYLAKSRLDSALLRRSIRYGIERKQAEKHIQHLNSVLRAIRDVNQLVVVEKDRASLFQKSCDALVEARGYDAAWLGFLKDGESFAIVAGSGPGEEASRIAEHLMRGEFPRCVRTMLAQEENLLVFDKRRECGACSFRDAYAGSTTVIIRVEHGGRHFGLLVISLGADITADQAEQNLLTEVASDIALALQNMELEEAHKQAEETLRQSEQKYRLLAETARDIILTHDMRGRITYFNKAALEQAGYREEEALQLSITDVVPANQLAQMKGRQARRTAGEHGVSTYETEFLTKAGRRIPIEVSSSVIMKHGKPSGILIIARDIGERKRAEEALRKSEKKFRELAELLPQVVYETDARGNLTFTNRNGFDAFGYTQADFAKGLNTLQMLVPEDHPRARENFQRTSRGEEARGHEYTALRKDGSTFPVALYSSAIIHEGEPAGLRGIIVDISERKQAEEALRKSNEAMSLLYEAGRRLSRTLDLDTLYSDVHDLISKVMDCDTLLASSYTPEDRLIRCDRAWHAGKPFPVSQLPPIPLEPEGHGSQSVVIRTGQPLLIRDYPERLKQTKTVYFVDEKGRTEGEKGYVPSDIPRSALMVPLKLEGQVVGVIKVASYAYDAYTEDDLQLLGSLAAQIALALRNATLYQQAQNEISNRIQAQEALRESEERFRQMAEVIPAVFWMFSGDNSQALYVSPAFEQVHGRSPESIYENPQSWLDAIHPEDRELVVRTNAEHRGKPYETEYRITRPDGSVRWIHNHILPVPDETGEIIRIVGLSEDITERKLAEEELRQRHQQLERFNAMAVDRELRMIKLKKEINALLQELGQEARYETLEGASGEVVT